MSGNADEPFSLGRAFKPESIGDDAVAQMVLILDEQDAMPSIERLRVWVLDTAGPQPGDRVVDVGSGTGTMARRLAAAVGAEGEVTGVEPNGMLRGVAEARAEADGSGAVFCQGLATEIPLPDESVDVVWCERVLQHVPDAQAAIAEIARVLRPGGRALLLDSDHGSRVDSDIDPDVARAITIAFMGQLANAAAARRIPRQAMAAGLVVDPDIGSSAVIYPQELLVDSPMLRMAAEQAVSDGSITRAQADEAMRAQTEAARAGWALSTVTVFGFVCRKP